jgi:hypothetical protein
MIAGASVTRAGASSDEVLHDEVATAKPAPAAKAAITINAVVRRYEDASFVFMTAPPGWWLP